MFNPTENSHFRKYVATLGISISLAALTAGGFLFRTQGDLLVEQKKLNELTSVARETIEQRQRILQIATGWTPWLVAAFVLIGIVLSVFGLKGWAQRQKSIDKREDLESDKLAAEIRTLTTEEKAQKVSEDVQEALGEAATEIDTPSAEHKKGERPAAEQSASQLPNVKIEDRPAEIARRLSNIEQTLVGKLRSAFPGWAVAPDVSIGVVGDDRKYEIDALISPPTPGARYVVEAKYLTTKKNLRNVLESAAINSVAAAKIITPNPTPENCSFPVIVIVTDNDSAVTAADSKRVLKRLTPALAIRPLVLTFTRDELSSVSPERLRITIKSAFSLN